MNFKIYDIVYCCIKTATEDGIITVGTRCVIVDITESFCMLECVINNNRAVPVLWIDTLHSNFGDKNAIRKKKLLKLK